MCGITGFYNPQLSSDRKEHLINAMLKTTTHRGPDSDGIYTDEFVALGHNRLKIIDLSDTANQPFEYDGLQLVYNGEIYNYVELRDELIQSGYRFRTRCDTEVIVAAYKKWGMECVSYFVGMWAFAIWDKSNKRLFCSRDRFGIKPFYYLRHNGNFYFSSEYHPLKVLPEFNGELNYDHVNRGLFLGWTDYPHDSFFRQINTLPARHNLVIENGEVEVSSYWDIDLNASKIQLPKEEREQMFFDHFRESVRIHSRSDVQLGGLLSGGLDSSSLASMFCYQFPDLDFKTFTIFYEGAGNVDERPFANEVIKKYPKIQPFYYSPGSDDLQEHFHNISHFTEVPLMGSSFVSQYFLMQLAAQNGVTVVMDGQGADEFLGGYMHTFNRMLGIYLSGFKPGKFFKLLANHQSRQKFSPAGLFTLLMKSGYAGLFSEQDIYNYEFHRNHKLVNRKSPKIDIPLDLPSKSKSRFDSFLYDLTFMTSLPTLLHYEDRTSMAFSLESRVPFLDHRLVELSFALPEEDKVSLKAETKNILRKSMKQILPAAVADRKDKKGFVTPGETQWLRGPLNYLLDMDFDRFHWLDPGSIRDLINDYKSGNNEHVMLVWRVASLHYWLKNMN